MSKGKKLTTTEFIEKAKAIHGDKYDYSKVNYIKKSIKIEIICINHNYNFTQTPHDHLGGHGCSKCKVDATKNRFKKIRESQYLDYLNAQKYCIENNIKSAKQYREYYKLKKLVFLPSTPDKFYKEDWINYQTFFKTKNSSGVNIIENKLKFIDLAKSIHGDKYSYDNINYINSKIDVMIHCNIHNYEFYQSPNSHTSKGCGCPKCSGRDKMWLNFNEARDFVITLGLKTKNEYTEWWDKNKPNFLPKHPSIHYKK
jgi:hypothetical protein